jgi:hypothetical protein
LNAQQFKTLLQTALRIRDILVRIRIRIRVIRASHQ